MTVCKPPAKRPCGSCPYRKDVPAGVWSKEEYEKLPPYDGETFEQPPKMFLCHRQDGHTCAGWVATHDMEQNLGFRLSCSQGEATEEWVDAFLDYTTDVPVWESGRAAAEHGLSDMSIGPHNQKVIERVRKGQV